LKFVGLNQDQIPISFYSPISERKKCTFVAGRKISIYEANPDDFAQQTFKIDFPNQPFVAFAEAGFHK
jgi:hypothetical protein